MRLVRHLLAITVCGVVINAAWHVEAQLGVFASSQEDGLPAADARAVVENEPLGLHPVTEELRMTSIRDVAPAVSGTGGTSGTSGTDESRDHHVKRQGYVGIRTMRIHPQPNLRHATANYEAFSPMSATHGAAIRQALSLPLGRAFDFQQASLHDVIGRLQKELNIPVIADNRLVTDNDVTIEAMSFTRKLEGLSLRSALRALLGENDLTYIIRDDALVITTKEIAYHDLAVRSYPIPRTISLRSIASLLESMISFETWEAQGGAGQMKAMEEEWMLVISQTEEVHDAIEGFLARIVDGDLSAAPPGTTIDPTAVATRIHAVRDEKVLQELQQKLRAMCNAALGAAGDPDATVSTLAGKLVVQSRKRSFHVYATEVIQSINGIDVLSVDYFGFGGAATALTPTQVGGSGLGGISGGLCWVAREVYGTHDLRWVAFRSWMLDRAPIWLRDGYAAHGEAFANWLRHRPLAKTTVRRLMDAIVAID
jgi:hypothetical protein